MVVWCLLGFCSRVSTYEKWHCRRAGSVSASQQYHSTAVSYNSISWNQCKVKDLLHWYLQSIVVWYLIFLSIQAPLFSVSPSRDVITVWGDCFSGLSLFLWLLLHLKSEGSAQHIAQTGSRKPSVSFHILYEPSGTRGTFQRNNTRSSNYIPKVIYTNIPLTARQYAL